MVERRKCRTWAKRAALCLAVLICLLLFFAGAAAAANAGVYDDAGLFSAREAAQLEEKAQTLYEAHHMNFVLVTTDDADGRAAREYADDFYMDHGFYENGARGGITLLIDMDNRELYVSTAGDMRYYITDARVEEILDAGYDEVADGEYAQAMENMLKKTDALIRKGIPGGQYLYDEETGRIVRYKSLTAAELCIAVLIPLLLAGGVCLMVVRKYSHVEKYQYAVGQNADIHFRSRTDRLVNQFVTKRHIPKSPPPGSGGGHGGGSGRTTVHTSGGGGSFGGGGRKF